MGKRRSCNPTDILLQNAVSSYAFCPDYAHSNKSRNISSFPRQSGCSLQHNFPQPPNLVKAAATAKKHSFLFLTPTNQPLPHPPPPHITAEEEPPIHMSIKHLVRIPPWQLSDRSDGAPLSPAPCPRVSASWRRPFQNPLPLF